MGTNILTDIENLRINPLEELSDAPAYCFINDKPSLTAGNFTLINGKKKAGKTFLLGGLLASTINNSLQLDAIRGCLPDDKRNVLYFDTEQSTYHANRSIKRICALTGNPNPNNLLAYGLRPLLPEERLKVIEAVILMTPNVGIVAIDGIRDLLTRGINDEAEATSLTSKFLKWSYDLDIHIVLLLHQNKSDINPRGHIGSEVVNKAETVISVTKEGKFNEFIVSCEDSRDISFDDFAFTITDEGLPIACNMPTGKERKTTDPQHIASEKHLESLRNIFASETEYTYKEIISAIKEEFAIGRDASSEFCNFYLGKNWLLKERKGMYTIYKFNNTAKSFFSN
jgi:hypothetical protein